MTLYKHPSFPFEQLSFLRLVTNFLFPYLYCNVVPCYENCVKNIKRSFCGFLPTVVRLERSLSRTMSKLYSWCSENNIIVNTQKTMNETFCLGNKFLNLNIFYDNTILRVIFDHIVIWKLNIDAIHQKSERQMSLLSRLTAVK